MHWKMDGKSLFHAHHSEFGLKSISVFVLIWMENGIFPCTFASYSHTYSCSSGVHHAWYVSLVSFSIKMEMTHEHIRINEGENVISWGMWNMIGMTFLSKIPLHHNCNLPDWDEKKRRECDCLKFSGFLFISTNKYLMNCGILWKLVDVDVVNVG